MSQRSCLTSFSVRSATLGALSLLLSSLACSGTDAEIPPGTGGSASTGGSGGAAAAGNGQTTAGSTSTGGGGSNVAGTSAAAGSSSTGGGGSGSGGSGAAGSSSGGTSSGGSGGGSGGSGGAGGSGGGSSGSGGAGGSGGGSSGSGGGGSGATDCSKLKLCDDFEGAAPGDAASPFKKMGAVEVVTDVHHSGTHSVHIKAASGAATNININTTKPFPSTDAWGRAWVQIKAKGTEHQMYIGINLQGDQGRLLNRLGSDTPQVNFQKGDQFYAAEVAFMQGTWFCYEWHVTDTATSIYIDGKKQMLKKGTNGDAPGIKGGTSLLLGFQRFVGSSGSADAEVWYDDVAVGDSQLGCH